LTELNIAIFKQLVMAFDGKTPEQNAMTYLRAMDKEAKRFIKEVEKYHKKHCKFEKFDEKKWNKLKQTWIIDNLDRL